MKPGLSSRLATRDCPVTFASLLYPVDAPGARLPELLAQAWEMIQLRDLWVRDRAIVVCASLAIVAGVFFRIHALARPLFWQDEVTTALRTTGHVATDYARIFDGRVHPMTQIRAFMEVDPAKGPFDVAATLAREDPQHVPLYYMLERLWIGTFGTSVVGMRGLSVLCGVVAIGLALVLGRQIEGSLRGGLIVASLFALSPLFILVSRQAREYALFVDVALLATIIFVAALRSDRVVPWVAYAAAVVCGVYTDGLFGLVVLGHGVVAVALYGMRSRAVAAWFGGAFAGALAFAPWAYAGATERAHVAQEEAWILTAYSPRGLAEKWAFNVGALAFDAEFASLRLAIVAVFGIVVLGLVVCLGLRSSNRLARTLPIAIAAPTLLTLVGVDLVRHTHFASVARYLIGTWIGLELAVAFGIAYLLGVPRRRPAAFAAWISLLALGLAAAVIRDGAENWWDNADPIAFQAVARTIDVQTRPFVISEDHWNVPLELGRYLPDDASMLLLHSPITARAPRTGPSFLVAPSAMLLAHVRASPGAFATRNVSPADRTLLAAFSRTKQAVQQSVQDPMNAQNALWLLVPR